MASKRKGQDEGTKNDEPSKRIKTKEKCFFGSKCYRRNPQHFKEFSHPHLEDLDSEPEAEVHKSQWTILKDLGLLNSERALSELGQVVEEQNGENQDIHQSSRIDTQRVGKNVESQEDSEHFEKNSGSSSDADLKEGPSVRSSHPILAKFEAAQPYNLFLTKVKDVPSTHKDQRSIFLTDLLHACHGSLKSTVQINFLVDFEWLKMSYEATGNQNIPLLILHGEDSSELRPSNLPDNVQAVRIRSPFPYGTHVISTYDIKIVLKFRVSNPIFNF